MTGEQLTAPGIETAKTVLIVTVHGGTRALEVDRDEWQAMNSEERDAYVYEAAEELGWFRASHAPREGR